MYQGGVDQSYVRWVPYDGVGRAVRNGLNFTERGFGLRGAVGCSDRGHTRRLPAAARATSTGSTSSAREGARWFHSGGIFAGLSETTAELALEAMAAAQRHGTSSRTTSTTASLWKGIGGRRRRAEVNQRARRRTSTS